MHEPTMGPQPIGPKTAVQITFRHLRPSEAITQLINEQVAKLEELAEHIVECRVVIDEPNHNHRSKHFKVEVVLLIDGAELVAGRELDESHGEDAAQVVHRNFQAIRRQLQDHIHRRQAKLKGVPGVARDKQDSPHSR